MSDWSRRDILSAVAGGLAGADLASKSPADTLPTEAPKHALRIRTLTAGVAVSGPNDVAPLQRAFDRLRQVRDLAQNAGYEVQTIRVATTPVVSAMDATARRSALAGLEKFDAAATAANVMLSIGPILQADRYDPDLGAWAAEFARRSRQTSFSVAVAAPDEGIHRAAIRSAADVIRALSDIDPSGSQNFRFAAAASVPAGTPFFPVGFHQGADSLAIGLESAGLLQAAFAQAANPDEATERMRHVLEAELAAIDRLGVRMAQAQGLRYLGIDTSPAPGMDRSIGAAIETLTGQPFGSASTLQACAAITAVLKSLSVRSCGYCGLMLPVLEDPVLARRATEARYGIQELLLYSTVCGTGLDVVPIPGATSAAILCAIIGDMATLAVRLRKPLSARLFPIPGKAAGDSVRFDDPRLTETRVFPVD